MIRLAIYTRKSILTNEGESIENQKSIIKNHFRNKQCQIIEFEDEGYTGGNTKRPDFNRMMTMARNHNIDAIAVYKIDRISRNIVDFFKIHDELEQLGINLISVTENFDATTPQGRMMMTMLAGVAEMERANIRQRVKDNKLESAKLGKWTGGNIPIGYIGERLTNNSNKEYTHLIVDSNTSEIVKSIYLKYLEFESINQVTKWVNKTYNLSYCLSSVTYILSSPVYVSSSEKTKKYIENTYNIPVYGDVNGLGYITYNMRPSTKSGLREWKSKSMFCAVSNHEPIIEEDLWIKTNILYRSRKKNPRPKKSKISYLTGLLKCGVCNSPLTLNYNHVNKDGTKNYYYVCTGKRRNGISFCSNKWIKQDLLDSKFREEIKILSSNRNLFNSLIEKTSYTSNYDTDINRINKNILKLNKQLTNLTNNLMNLNGIAADKVLEKMNELSDSISDLKLELSILETKKQMEESSNINQDIIFDLLKEFNDVFDTLESIDEKRTLVNKFISSITWTSDKEEIKITPI